MSANGTTTMSVLANSYASSTATITATATLTGPVSATATGTATVTTSVVTNADITYRYSTTGTNLKGSDFYSALVTSLGSNYTSVIGSGTYSNFYVVFGTPVGGQLYKSASYTGTSYNTVGSTPAYYTSYGISGSSYLYLDNIYFLENSTYTYNNSRYVDYTVYNTANVAVATGRVYFNNSYADITYTVAAGGSVTFNTSDFNTFVRKAAGATNYSSSQTGYNLNYVTFDMKNATFGSYAYSTNNTYRYGALYTTSALKTEITSSDYNTKFYNTTSAYNYSLSNVTFGASNYSTNYVVIIPFTAVNNNNNSYSGNVYITVKSGHAITILGADFGSEKIPAEVTADYSTAAYVQFTLPSSSDGKLYYNYTSIATGKNTAVTATGKYYITASGTQNALKYVYFVPAADKTGTVNVAYTAYNTAGTNIGSGTISFTVTGRTSSSYYSDVTSANTGSWSANAVDFMAYNDLVKGTGTYQFSPYMAMTRAMFVTVLYRAAGEPSVSSIANPFKDVKSGEYYYNAVLWAYRNNIVTGTSGTAFNPDGKITREQIAAILYRYMGSPTVRSSLTGYTDSNKVSSYAVNAMNWAVYNGYIQGSGYKLNPTSNATRAEVAVMLYRFLTK
jgi:hypothetical protein